MLTSDLYFFNEVVPVAGKNFKYDGFVLTSYRDEMAKHQVKFTIYKAVMEGKESIDIPVHSKSIVDWTAGLVGNFVTIVSPFKDGIVTMRVTLTQFKKK